MQDPVVISWQKVYEDLAFSAEFAKSSAPAVKSGRWTMPVLRGITCNAIISAFRRHGVAVYLYEGGNDLDTTVTNLRDPNKTGAYAISFVSNAEADEEYEKFSADELSRWGIQGTTLLEYLLLNLGYFLATGNLLDQETTTLCSGSRTPGGHVPTGSCPRRKELHISWVGVNDANPRMRTRAKVAA